MHAKKPLIAASLKASRPSESNNLILELSEAPSRMKIADLQRAAITQRIEIEAKRVPNMDESRSIDGIPWNLSLEGPAFQNTDAFSHNPDLTVFSRRVLPEQQDPYISERSRTDWLARNQFADPEAMLLLSL